MLWKQIISIDILVVVYLLALPTESRDGTVQSWFRSHGLSCKFCRKKYQSFGLLPVGGESKQTNNVTISFDGTEPKCKLSDKFLSFSLDTLELKRNLRCFPLSSAKINTLVSALAPAYIRVGGTPQDFLLFTDKVEIPPGGEQEENKIDQTVEESSCTPSFENWETMKPFYYHTNEFEALYNFTFRNGLRLIFGLNALVRDDYGAWTPSNSITADLLKKYAEKVDWEIGNEPNRFNKYGQQSIVKPKQLARDKRKLRNFLKSSKVKIYGPDIARPTLRSLKYLKKFLAEGPHVDAVTYHMYDMNQAKATLEDFLNPIYLLKLQEEMSWVSHIVRSAKTAASQADIWIGETGSASGGGAPGLSDRFVSGFLYLGKLGLASEACHKVVIRQSLYGGNYGMLDPVTHNPLPDYWITVLFKKLVGNIVLGSSRTGNSFLRAHFYCSNMAEEDVVISVVNMKRDADFFLTIKNFEDRWVEMFLFTNSNLQSSSTYLNGQRLELDGDSRLPTVKGKIVQQPVRIPMKSYGFLVVRNVKAKACLFGGGIS